MWNTDVLNPDATAEFRDGLDPSDPRSDRTSTEFDPYYVTIPFFYHRASESGAMAGSFVDNSYRASYAFSDPEEYRIRFEGGQWQEYVFAGPSMAGILEAYTSLTGRASLPPMWALGYHQCRWYAYTQDEVEALGDRLRDDRLPCDTLWLDIDYMDGYRVFTWDEDRFPDHVGMLKRLRDNRFRMVTIVDPGVKHDPGYPVYDEGVERDVFCRTEGGGTYIGQVWPGNTAFPDFATAEARAWWGELNAAHVGSGLAGIWNDMNEPATGVIPPGTMLFDKGRASHNRFHNQYALLMAMGTTEGLLAAEPELRTFILSRAGFAGIQRYAANWMGDNHSRWDHLWLSTTMACGFGISGQPFVGADIGGFAGDTTPGAVPALDAGGDADSLLPQPRRDRHHRPVPVVVRPRDRGPGAGGARAALPPAALPLHGLRRARPRPASRCSDPSSSTTRTTRRRSRPTTSSSSVGTCSSRP